MNYHAALAHFPKITYARYQKLAAYFLRLENLWQAELGDIVSSGIEEAIAHEFIVWREQNPVEKILDNLSRENISTVSLPEPGYPSLLKEIADPPHTLFLRGRLPTDQLAVAIVGTRRCTSYGRQVADELAQELAARGLTIVSGLALGIDGYAHAAALKAKGLTMAVLGSGLDDRNIQPSSHRYLAKDIISTGGALVSEYPPGFSPTKYSFPTRNRIIAGLSLGAIIVEAPLSSGALITARCALDYNREVLAVPHPINSSAGEGGNNLIKQGARLVAKADDVVDALNLHHLTDTITRHDFSPANEKEARIWACLSREPKHVDLIIKNCGLDSSSVNSTLVLMEMRSEVKNLGGMMYIKNC